MRDLYYPFEMYFDDDTFVTKEIPSGLNDPSVMDADIILVLDGGQIVARGTHTELLSSSSVYREVYESQQQGAN